MTGADSVGVRSEGSLPGEGQPACLESTEYTVLEAGLDSKTRENPRGFLYSAKPQKGRI